MNLGLFLSLVAGFIWSIGNVIDKVAVARIVRSPVVLLYFYIALSVVTGACAYPFAENPLASKDILEFIGVSAMYTLGVVLYFRALQKEEPSRVVPLYALVVLFLSIFGAIFLGEVFTLPVYCGIGLLVVGTVGLTSRGDVAGILHSKALVTMVLSTLSFTGAYILMKRLLVPYSAWEVFAYQRVFTGLVGLFILPFAYRHIRAMLQGVQNKKLLLWSGLGELLGECGAFLFVIASSIWYVTLVETAVNIQFVFIFLWGVLITKRWPQFYTEVVDRRTLARKAITICLIIGGIYLISIY